MEYITRGFEQLGYIEKGRYPIGVLADLRAVTTTQGTQTTPPEPPAFGPQLPTTPQEHTRTWAEMVN